jgi:hypothetical protein
MEGRAVTFSPEERPFDIGVDSIVQFESLRQSVTGPYKQLHFPVPEGRPFQARRVDHGLGNTPYRSASNRGAFRNILGGQNSH